MQNHLRQYGIVTRHPAEHPVLTQCHRQTWLQWCKNHVRYTDNGARSFSHESRSHIDGSDGRQRVYQRTGKCYSDSCVVQQCSWGGGSVMAWGSITEGISTPLLVIDGNPSGYQVS